MDITKLIGLHFVGVQLDKEPKRNACISFIEARAFTFAYINGSPTGQKPGSKKVYFHSYISAN